jgi:hypothetical protein
VTDEGRRMPIFPPFDEAAYQRRCAEAREERVRLDEIGGFRPVSLGDWLDLCQQSGVPTVPAVLLGEADLDAIVRFDEPEVAQRAAPFYARVRQTLDDLGPGWMARWDCCSMAALKYRLSSGVADWDPELAELYADDLRAYDVLCDFPGERMTAWARPWTSLAMIEGFPVEYRVFVERNEIVGVSNYYPQRPLPDDEATACDIARARRFTEQLIAAQTRPLVCPQIGEVEGNWFTADFARLASGALIFLEGGPPHTPRWGAHPCCFEDGDVKGIALRDRTGRHELNATEVPESAA